MKKLILSALILLVSAPAFAGRFELVQLGNMRRDQYLVDTQTGEMWSRMCQTATSDSCVWVKELVTGKNITPNDARKLLSAPELSSAGKDSNASN